MENAFLFHLVEELAIDLTADRFRAAFPIPHRNDVVTTGATKDENTSSVSSFILGDPDRIPYSSTATKLDRFAFMGAEPIATLRATRMPTPSQGQTQKQGRSTRLRARVVITEHERQSAFGDLFQDSSRRPLILEDVDPFEALRELIARYTPKAEVLKHDAPFPFRAGLVGYIGYECGQTLERLPCRERPGIGMPDMAFAVHDWVLAKCHDTGRSFISVLAKTQSDAERIRDRVVGALHQANGKNGKNGKKRGAVVVGSSSTHPPSIHTSRPRQHDAELSCAEYMDRVATAKEHIACGDAFEICLTNALRMPLRNDHAWDLFHELRASNPAPFSALLDLPEGAIISSSPERFLSLDPRSNIVESRPIKGTRPRGASSDDDARLVQELATSVKDRAENAMIVDLVRNDLGRVCRFGSIDVPDLYVVEPYATVHQLVSTVRGTLAQDKDRIDLIRACFPPGSMTGAPKIEAMSILEQLEPVERGVYSGALGWMDLGGAMDLSVVIRTVVVKNNVATFSVGGAIVADSDPQSEHEETEHKAHALVRAIRALCDPPNDGDDDEEPSASSRIAGRECGSGSVTA